MKEIKDQPHADNIEQQTEIDLQFNQASRYIENIVTEISQSPSNFMNFAYELRRQDIDDEFSYDFLNGQVQPPILNEIILSNKWCKTMGKMVVSENEK